MANSYQYLFRCCNAITLSLIIYYYMLQNKTHRPHATCVDRKLTVCNTDTWKFDFNDLNLAHTSLLCVFSPKTKPTLARTPNPGIRAMLIFSPFNLFSRTPIAANQHDINASIIIVSGVDISSCALSGASTATR